jgi:hypothetical protein
VALDEQGKPNCKSASKFTVRPSRMVLPFLIRQRPALVLGTVALLSAVTEALLALITLNCLETSSLALDTRLN